MDIKDSYLHGTVGVVKSISVSADKLKYTLADIAGTVREVTLPVATTSANGLMSSGDKTKLDNLSTTLGNYVTLNTDQEITGIKTFTKQLKFTVAKGTAPFLVTSDTKVDNLNADMLDGLDSSRYLHSVAYDANLDFNVVKGINNNGGCVNNANYILSGDNQLSNSPYSYGIMTTLNNGAAGMDFATNGPLGFTIGLKFRKRWLNNLSEWKEIAFTDSNITGNAATATHASTADKLKTKRKLWGLNFDGSADVSGEMTGVGNITIASNGNVDRFITFDTTSTRNWRIGYLGTGSGDANYLIFQSTKTLTIADGWYDMLKIGCETGNAILTGLLTAKNFVSGDGINDFSAGTVKLDVLNIPTSSGGTTFGPGSNGQVLKSNGTTVYWASDNNSNTWRDITNDYDVTTPSDTISLSQRGAKSLLRNVRSFKRFYGTSANEGYDLNTLTEGMIYNYGSSGWWKNAPSGMSYGRVLNLKDGSGGSIAGQLAWDTNHNNTTDTTRNLWWRVSDDGTFTEAKWHRIAYAEEIPTVTNYYWANVKISNTSNDATSPTFATATATRFIASGTNQYKDAGGLVMNNSDIWGLNAIYTADKAEDATEGYLFKRSDGNYDSVWSADGTFYYSPNGNPTASTLYPTNYVVCHSGNSAVSGAGGSTWGSSITVKINGTSKTLTIPSNPNTDSNVSLSETTTSSYRPVILGYTSSSTAGSGMTTSTTNEVYASNKIYALPSTGTLYATTFSGSLAWSNITGKPTIPTVYERNLGVNGTNWTFYAPYSNATTSIYAPTSVGTSGYILQSLGSGAPSWTSRLSYSYPGVIWVGYIYRSARSYTTWYIFTQGGSASVSMYISSPTSSNNYQVAIQSSTHTILGGMCSIQAQFNAGKDGGQTTEGPLYAYSTVDVSKIEEAGPDVLVSSVYGGRFYIKAMRASDANNSSYYFDGLAFTGAGKDTNSLPLARINVILFGY